MFLTAHLTELLILAFLPPLCKHTPTSSIWASSLVNAVMHAAGRHGHRRQVHIIKPCHYHEVNHVMSWLHLRMRVGGQRWLTRHSISSPHEVLHCTFLYLVLLSFAITHFLFPPLLSSHRTAVYCCMSSSPSAAVFNHVIPLVLSYQACHPLPPCPRSVSLTFYPHAGSLFLSCPSVILPCSCHLSCPRSLSACPTSSFFIVPLSGIW